MDKRVQIFLKDIYPKVNVIARLEFELTYFEAAVQLCSYGTKWILLYKIGFIEMIIIVVVVGCVLLVLSRYPSLFFIVSNVWTEMMYISLCWSTNTVVSMNPSLIYQLCQEYLHRLCWVVSEMGRGQWPCSYCFVRCCFQDLLTPRYSIFI